MGEGELALEPETGESERIRLRALLGRDGTLEELNWELCRRIADGSLGLDDPDLVDHLRQTTLDKVAIDQPNYAGYRRALERWGDAPPSRSEERRVGNEGVRTCRFRWAPSP